jgi:phosphate transport system ATP-binding protein
MTKSSSAAASVLALAPAPAPIRSSAKLSARGVDFFYGGEQALKAIDLDVPENRITALIGPSGCG